MILNIASRHNSTSYNNLENALKLAKERYLKKDSIDNIKRIINFNVQPYNKEPILSIADYFCWSVQRIFEMGETRFYNFLEPQIKLVFDVWDIENYKGNKNYYKGKNKLTEANKIKKPSLP